MQSLHCCSYELTLPAGQSPLTGWLQAQLFGPWQSHRDNSNSAYPCHNSASPYHSAAARREYREWYPFGFLCGCAICISCRESLFFSLNVFIFISCVCVFCSYRGRGGVITSSNTRSKATRILRTSPSDTVSSKLTTATRCWTHFSAVGESSRKWRSASSLHACDHTYSAQLSAVSRSRKDCLSTKCPSPLAGIFKYV
jgi:hypothetical protein